jgi:ABC-type polysaccharide/polyol phosphate export permease
MSPSSGLDEVTLAFRNRNPWLLLGWFDVRQRYRRSVLGPLWLTLSTAILVGILGLLWSSLFKMNIKEYMPYFTIGHVTWGFMVMQVNDSCTGFSQFEHIIKQTRLPMATYTLRLLTRNVAIFAHNSLVIVVVLTFVGSGWSWNALYFIPAFALLLGSLFGVSVITAVLCTKYRDMQPIIQNITTIAFFVTPIMWKPDLLGPSREWIATLNPIAHLLHIVREPLLGHTTNMTSWIWSIAIAVVVNAIALLLLDRYSKRIAYWL